MVDVGGMVVYSSAMCLWRVGDGQQGTLCDGEVYWICNDVCCSSFCLHLTNGVESLWNVLTICLTTCGMADGTQVSNVSAIVSLGSVVTLDAENVYGCLDEYLTGGNYRVGASALNSPDPRQHDDRCPEAPEEEPFQGVDLAEAALNHVYQFNGRNVDQTVGETEADDRANTPRGVHGTHVEEENDKMEVDETPAERRARYMSSSQEEVSDPEKGAETHYGNLDVSNYERMVVFSRANQFRLRGALQSLRTRRNTAEVDGNW